MKATKDRRPRAKKAVAPAPRAGGTRRFEAKREAIISAGTEIINYRGVKGMTLASVAEAVGLNTTSVTYYFKRKEDLAAACVLRGIEIFDALILEAAKEPTASARISQLIRLNFESYARIRLKLDPPRSVLNDLMALGKDAAGPVLAKQKQMFGHMKQLLADGPVSAEMGREIDARTFLFMVLIHWAPIWMTHYDIEDYPRIAERMIDVVLNGLAPSRLTKWPASAPLPVDSKPDAQEMFLIAATELINEQGYHGASIDRISARLNVTKGSFYHHLDTKDDLVSLCFARTFEVMGKAQRAAMALPANGWGQLAAACSSLLQFQLSDRGPLLEFSAFSALPTEMLLNTVQQSDRIPYRFAEMISSGVADGSIRAVDPFIAGQCVTAMIVTLQRLSSRVTAVSVEEATTLYARPLFYGLLTY